MMSMERETGQRIFGLLSSEAGHGRHERQPRRRSGQNDDFACHDCDFALVQAIIFKCHSSADTAMACQSKKSWLRTLP